MAPDTKLDDELRDATRLQNSAYRTLTRNLRGRLAQVQSEADEKIKILFSTPLEAQAAFQELHTRLKLTCSSDDFMAIVEDICKNYVMPDEF